MTALTEVLSPNIHCLHGSFRPGYGPSHTTFLVSEEIWSCRELHNKAYLALLDAKKDLIQFGTQACF
jgi:hypothetical protein